MDFEDNRKDIRDDFHLWRRIPQKQIVPLMDNKGIYRVSSGAFQNTSGTKSMSVSIANLVKVTPEIYLSKFPEAVAIVSITAGQVRECNQGVIHTPQDDDNAHGEVIGEKPKSFKKKMARICEWVIKPINLDFSDYKNTTSED